MASLTRRPTWRRALFFVAALLVATEVPGVIESLRQPDIGFKVRQHTVMSVAADGPAAGQVRAGDRLMRVNAVPIGSFADLRAALHGGQPGQALDLRLWRQGAVVEVSLVLEPKNLEDRVYGLLLSAVAIAFLFLGFVTFYRRDDELGHAFFLTCLFLAYPFLDLPTSSSRLVMRILEGIHDSVQVFMPALLLRFLMIFPEGIDAGSPRYRRQRWILLPAAALTPLHFWSHFASDSPSSQRLLTLLFAATTLVFVAYVLAAFIVFARKIRRRDRWVLWSKLRLALSGLVAGLFPLLAVTVLRQVVPTEQFFLDRLAILLLPLVPLSFSTAMLRTGAIDVADIRRQLAIGGFVLVPTALLLAGVPSLARFLGLSPPTGFSHVPFLVGIPALLLLTRLPQRLGHEVADRIFDPDLQEMRREASALASRISGSSDAEEIGQIFARGLLDLIGAHRVTLYEASGESFQLLADASKTEGLRAALPEFDAQIPVVKSAMEDQELLLVEAVLAGGARSIDPLSRRWLDRSDASILFPLMSAGNCVGMGLLSGPVGRHAYRSGHLYHTQSLAQLAGAAIENAKLHEEDIARERLQTELALAHEIQARLLPQSDLMGPDFEVCGRTVSCREVGGDLFDHFRLSDGSVVVSVADASGKGVPASLLISGLRTSIRETVRPGFPLADALAHINRAVHETTQVGHFIAAFVGVYHPAHGELEYCVAGIEAPIWVRAGLQRLERLHRGGPVLGIEPEAHFRSGIVHLAPGDRVLAYSDGVTDQVDSADEPFGADRLASIARSEISNDAKGMLEAVFGALSAFRGDEIVDDTTLLVLSRPRTSSVGMMSAS